MGSQQRIMKTSLAVFFMWLAFLSLNAEPSQPVATKGGKPDAAATAKVSPSADAEIPPPKDEPQIINAGPPPSDAIVLFDGKDLSQWQGENGTPARWEIKDGVATVNGSGSISTKQGFGDCQLHLEWAAPTEVKGSGQGRGNS